MANENKYYNPSVILGKKDLDGLEPSIYMITSNRSAGKTTGWLKEALEKYHKTGHQLMLIYRYKYELTSAHEIFKDVLKIYPDLGIEMKCESKAQGLFYALMLDGEEFGFVCSLSNVDSLKKYSPLFVKVFYLIMDEFQKEDGKYLPQEFAKLQSLLVTVARGGGSQSRNIKCILLGNMVSLLNPYFVNFNIHSRIKNDTKFLRGNGWIAEFNFNVNASNAIKNNGLFRAFKDTDYMQYSTESVYLHDSSIFIEKPKGKSRYIATIIHDGVQFGLREYYEEGIVHVSRKPDTSCKTVVTFKANDHNQHTIMLSRYSWVWKNIDDAYKHGYLRFDDMRSKSAIFDILSVDVYK